MRDLTLNEIADSQWEWVEKMGWHNKLPIEYVALIGSEVGESVNECRGAKPTEKLGAELADIILRTVGFAKECGIDIGMAVADKMAFNLISGTRGRLK